jgi:drug/metabolite transporter (DMT)-like permease
MRRWSERAHLWACFCAGLVFAVYGFIYVWPYENAEGARAWPGTASQVLGTLLLALVVEGRIIAVRVGDEAERAATVLVGCALVSFVDSVFAASSGRTFARGEMAAVGGSIAALGFLVMTLAIRFPRAGHPAPAQPVLRRRRRRKPRPGEGSIGKPPRVG